MTDHTDADNADDTTDSTENSNGGGIGGAVRSLLDAVSELQTEGKIDVNRSPGGRGRTDYGFSVSTLDAATDRKSADADREGDSRGTDAEPKVADEEYATAIQPVGDGVVATADLPGVDAKSLSAGVDETSKTLTIADDERVLTRIPLQRGELKIADATFNNGVLELHLQPIENTT